LLGAVQLIPTGPATCCVLPLDDAADQLDELVAGFDELEELAAGFEEVLILDGGRLTGFGN